MKGGLSRRRRGASGITPKTYDDNDYRPLPDSTRIDAGINEDWMWGTLDLEGKTRFPISR